MTANRSRVVLKIERYGYESEDSTENPWVTVALSTIGDFDDSESLGTCSAEKAAKMLFDIVLRLIKENKTTAKLSDTL